MRSSHTLDRLDTAFDDDHLVADAGLLLPATLAQHLGLRELVNEHLDLGAAPGRAHVGDKLLTLILSALARGDSIDDADRGDPEAAWTPIPYWLDGGADVAETTYTPFADGPDAKPVRLIVRRVKPTPGSQLALLTLYDVHAFITDREGDTLELEADHRRHAEIENAIRDLKYGVGLNHLPSGKFAANGAWLAVQVLAHNLARWTARIGLKAGIVTTRTLRRRLFNLAGRLTRSARRLTLHLPARWPWAISFTAALVRLRALPLLV